MYERETAEAMKAQAKATEHLAEATVTAAKIIARGHVAAALVEKGEAPGLIFRKSIQLVEGQ